VDARAAEKEMNSYFEKEVYGRLGRLEHLIERILHLLEHKPVVYTAILTQEDTMAIGNINAGSTGTFAATLLSSVDGAAPSPVTPQPTMDWTYSCSDSTVTITPSADTTSAVYSVPSNDTGTSFQAAASAVAPDGTTVTTPPLTVTLTPGTTSVVFSATIAQTA
jgi:hypothetical protein